MSPEMKEARACLKKAYDLVGEDGLRDALMDLGSTQLMVAIATVYSDTHWISKFWSLVQEPQHANQTAFLMKVIDKFIPSPQAVKKLQDVPDQFVIQYTKPEEEESDETT